MPPRRTAPPPPRCDGAERIVRMVQERHGLSLPVRAPTLSPPPLASLTGFFCYPPPRSLGGLAVQVQVRRRQARHSRFSSRRSHQQQHRHIRRRTSCSRITRLNTRPRRRHAVRTGSRTQPRCDRQHTGARASVGLVEESAVRLGSPAHLASRVVRALPAATEVAATTAGLIWAERYRQCKYSHRRTLQIVTGLECGSEVKLRAMARPCHSTFLRLRSPWQARKVRLFARTRSRAHNRPLAAALPPYTCEFRTHCAPHGPATVWRGVNRSRSR